MRIRFRPKRSLIPNLKVKKLSYPSFFLGEVPVLPPVEEGEEQLSPEEAFQLGFEVGAETSVTHLNDYWIARLAANRNNANRTYTELTNRLDWLYDIFRGATPNPNGETS
jgi:hypothetical protein